MIHHLSIAAYNPQHVAQILAELLQVEAFPFPAAGFPNSCVAVSLDSYGTFIDVHPFSAELIPGSEVEAFNPGRTLIHQLTLPLTPPFQYRLARSKLE